MKDEMHVFVIPALTYQQVLMPPDTRVLMVDDHRYEWRIFGTTKMIDDTWVLFDFHCVKAREVKHYPDWTYIARIHNPHEPESDFLFMTPASTSK